MLRFLHAVERRLFRNAPTNRLDAAPDDNLIARVHKFWERCRQLWHEGSAETLRGNAQERTAALLVDVDRATIIDRYEPRLRKDLSRTLQDLIVLQELRWARRGREEGGRNASLPFRQTNPSL